MKYCPFCKSTYDNQVVTCGRADCTGVGQALRTLGDGPEARYDLHDRQADTGAFELWRARDRVTQADVAFTIIGKTSASEQERVDGELGILRKVRHAHVAGVADSGRMADGRIFFVSEAQDGTMLDASFDKGVWSFQRAKRVVRQVGEGLLEIHKLGVLHRDLSPRNVLISRTGEAKVVNIVLAPAGKFRGEKDYLSPEQLAGRAVDRRANTYNLAAILYRLVTGHAARSGDAAGAASADVIPPSQRCSTNGLTAEIDRVVMKALEVQPGNRQPTLRSFLAEVEALTAREGDAPKPGPVEAPAATKPALVEASAAKAAPAETPPVKPAPAAATSTPATPPPPVAPAMPSFARPAVSARLAAISAARPAAAPATPPAKASEPGVVAKPASVPASGPRRAEPAAVPPAGTAPAIPAQPPVSAPVPARSSTVAGFATLSRLEQDKLAERLKGESSEAPAAKPAPAAEGGALAKDDIAKLLSAAKARPAASEAATPKAPEAPPAPAEEPAAPPAAGGSLGRNDIASLLSAAKARQTPGGEAAAPIPADKPADDATIDVKKKLIEQMVRQSKASMPVVAAAPAPVAVPTPAPVVAAAPTLSSPAAEAPVALAFAAPAAKPAAPPPSLPPKVVDPTDSPDFVDAANARYLQNQRQRKIAGILIVVALGAGATFAKMFLGKHTPASTPHSAAAPESPAPAPAAEVQAAVAGRAAQPVEPPAAAAAPEPARHARGELAINSENRPPAPRKASDGEYKQLVAKRVSKGVGAYLQELKGIDRSSLVPAAPPTAPPVSKSARTEAPKTATPATAPTPTSPAK